MTGRQLGVPNLAPYPRTFTTYNVLDTEFGFFANRANGITDDAIAFNTFFLKLKTLGGKGIIPGEIEYFWRSPINLTRLATGSRQGFDIEGSYGVGTNAPLPGSAAIRVIHTGHTFDCTGGFDISWRNIQIDGDATTVPKTGWFLARNSLGSDCGDQRFFNCRTSGHFSVAPMYNYGSEGNELYGCYFINNHAAAKTMYITGRNVMNLSSTFIAVATGPQSCILHTFNGGQYWQNSAASDCLHLEGCGDVLMNGTWFLSGTGASVGRAAIYLDVSQGDMFGLNFNNIVVEDPGVGFQSQYGIYAGGNASAARNISEFNVSGRFPTSIKSLFMEDGITVGNSDFSKFRDTTGVGLSFYNLDGSTIKQRNCVVAIRNTSNKNELTMDRTLLSLDITKSTGDILLDTLDASSPLITHGKVHFTPACLIGATNVTAYTLQRGTIRRVGNRVDFWIQMTISVVGAAVGALSITGIPALFTPSSDANEQSLIIVRLLGGNLPLGSIVYGVIVPGNATIFLQTDTGGAPVTTASATQTNLAAGMSVYAMGSYFVD